MIDWSAMRGGYRHPYDPRPAIAQIRANPLDQAAWDELWNELHHQGDVDSASYAAVPLLIDACRAGPRDWNLYALVGTIETERHRRKNPPILPAIVDTYVSALEEGRNLALSDLATTRDPLVLRSTFALIAVVAGDIKFGALLGGMSSGEIDELAEETMAWSTAYRDADREANDP